MIKLTPTDSKGEHSFILQADQPMRVEVWSYGLDLFCHVYTGTEIDKLQDVVAGYDSTIGPNSEWLWTDKGLE